MMTTIAKRQIAPPVTRADLITPRNLPADHPDREAAIAAWVARWGGVHVAADQRRGW